MSSYSSSLISVLYRHFLISSKEMFIYVRHKCKSS
nr:MAG TPA: hypothetical protein [Caudoviricetes sp.]